MGVHGQPFVARALLLVLLAIEPAGAYAATAAPDAGAAGLASQARADRAVAAANVARLEAFVPPDPPPLASPLALASGDITRRPGTPPASDETGALVPGADRARILLRSLTIPGWGQATLGHRTSAWVFGLAEAGIWTTFASFKIQEQLRRDAYENTARLFAGVDLSKRDEEFKRIVGAYVSSDEYNQLVVFRDAANLFYDDPVKYREYIADHELKGADAWSWKNLDALFRYSAQRQREHRASNRANLALAVAIGNRILSAIHASRLSGPPAATTRRWEIEAAPVGGDLSNFRFGVRTRF
jgi:hypothetical protein